MIIDQSKKILKYLFAAAVFLLISYLVIEKIYPDSRTSRIPVKEQEAELLLERTLHEFGIKKSWYKKQENLYTVKLPDDVPSELIVMDLSDKLNGRDVSFDSKEVLKNRKTVTEIYSDDELLLSAEFITDKSIRRESQTVSFIIMNSDELGSEEILRLLKTSENFAIALIPSKSSRALADTLAAFNKKFVVLLNDDISGLEYALDDKFSDKKLITTIKTITDNFRSALFFVLDDISSLYSSRVNEILTKELAKRKISYRRLRDYIIVDEDISSLNIENLLSTGNSRTFCINASDFSKIVDRIGMMRKRGIRIDLPSADN